jgi:hypothetical protein
MAGRLRPPGHGTLDFPNSEDIRIEGWRVAVSSNGNPLPRVPAGAGRETDHFHCTMDISQTRFREPFDELRASSVSTVLGAEKFSNS